MRLHTRIFAAGLLAAGIVAAPAAAANAGTTFTVTWIDSYGSTTQSYSCSGAPSVQPGLNVDKVSNDCGTRVWLHQSYSEPGNVGAGNSYCINPGAVAYAFSTTVDFEQVQPTSNRAACDVTSSGSPVQVTPTWWNGVYDQYSQGTSFPADCTQGNKYWAADSFALPGEAAWYYLLYLTNSCNTRIWVHQYQNGDGASYCISPGARYDATTGAGFTWEQAYGGEQILISSNQSPCSAG